MRSMRMPALVGACVVSALGMATAANAEQGQSSEYVVVYKTGVSRQDARAAIAHAGGRVVSENTDIGVATVRSDDASFAANAAGESALEGAAANKPIGHAPAARIRAKGDDVERSGQWRGQVAARGKGGKPGPVTLDPLADRQWDMRQIGATPEGSYGKQQGSHDVRVGIIDTGVDASHPDIAPNFDSGLSRNFTVDDPTIDGPCADEPDKSCNDPATVDEAGHGTHVAGTIGAPLNGIGTSGVAPKVDLVNLRAGQDSGFFFLGPSLDALTYAGDHGIDVVNMSYYIDPWLFNCRSNPADSPAEQRDQTLIIEATQRAVDYARQHGVTLIAATGNEDTDLGHPDVDPTSPDYPPDTARTRTVDNSCLSMPTEATGVIGVNSTGNAESAPSHMTRKAYYSNYGLEQSDVSAPGGDVRIKDDGARHPEDAVLAPYPENVAREEGLINPDGTAVPPLIRDCQGGRCGYYNYLQGTSMASPHAVGVAALAIAQYGHRDPRNGGLTMNPDQVEKLLLRTATDTPCPAQNPFVYPFLPDNFTAFCEGTPQRNGFFGEGIVNAARIVGARGRD